VKRLADFALALAGLILLSPVMTLVGILIKATSAGPIIFRQKRVGANGTLFEMYKFRTMRVEAPGEVATHLLIDADRHLTPIGGFLRRSSLDELPQLVNVLKGEMSLVGPRPALWNQYDLIEARHTYGADTLRPGVTGWAQINGRDELDVEEKARLDGFYAAHRGFMMDVRCLLGSLGAVVAGKGVVEGSARPTGEVSGARGRMRARAEDDVEETL